MGGGPVERVRAALAALLLLSLGMVSSAGWATEGMTMSAHDPFDDLDGFYEAYGKAFTAADVATIDVMFEYPYLLTNAEGSKQVENVEFYRSLLEHLKQVGFAGSRVSNYKKIRMGKDGAIIIVDYMRLRADGSELNGNTAAYLLRHRADGWKLVGIVDGYGK